MAGVHVRERVRDDRAPQRDGDGDEDPVRVPVARTDRVSVIREPYSASASPRNTICGHAIGIVCGYLALFVTGLATAPPALIAGVDPARVLAAALSLAATGALMVLLDAAHPPAGATTLIVSLGIVTRPFDLLVIEFAVVVLVGQAIMINRAAGLDYPLWRRSPRFPEASATT